MWLTSAVTHDSAERQRKLSKQHGHLVGLTGWDGWSLYLSNTDILYTYTLCLKGWEGAIHSASMQQEPSPIWHTASKMAVSSLKQWLYLTCVLYPLVWIWSTQVWEETTSVSHRGPSLPQRCSCLLSPVVGALSIHLKVKFDPCHKHIYLSE